jgi:hypothetical protein
LSALLLLALGCSPSEPEPLKPGPSTTTTPTTTPTPTTPTTTPTPYTPPEPVWALDPGWVAFSGTIWERPIQCNMAAGVWPVDLDGDGHLEVFGVTTGCVDDPRGRLFAFSAAHPPGDPYPDAWMDWVWEEGKEVSLGVLHWDGDQPGVLLTDAPWYWWHWEFYYEPKQPIDYDFYAFAPGEREIGDDGDLALEPGWTYYPARWDTEPRADLGVYLRDQYDALVVYGWCPSGDLCRSGVQPFPELPPGDSTYGDITGDGLPDAKILLDSGVDGVVDASAWELLYRDGDGYLPFEPPVTLTLPDRWTGAPDLMPGVVPDLTGDGVPELWLWELPVEPETTNRSKVFFSHAQQSGDPRALAHTTFTCRYPEDQLGEVGDARWAPSDRRTTDGITVADFDADGDNDLALLLYNPDRGWRVSVFRGPLTGGALTEDTADRVTVLHPVGECEGPTGSTSVADTDGDGAADLLVNLGCRDGRVFYLPRAGL